MISDHLRPLRPARFLCEVGSARCCRQCASRTRPASAGSMLLGIEIEPPPPESGTTIRFDVIGSSCLRIAGWCQMGLHPSRRGLRTWPRPAATPLWVIDRGYSSSPGASPLPTGPIASVATTGTDGLNDCTASSAPCRTVGYAVGQASAGDEIKVGHGVYVEQLMIAAPAMLTRDRRLGGWLRKPRPQGACDEPEPRLDPESPRAATIRSRSISTGCGFRRTR